MGSTKPENISDEVRDVIKEAEKVAPVTEDQRKAFELRGD